MPINTPFVAGWAAREITPDVPCQMGGYAARVGAANVTHDPLYAYALALGSREQPLVLIVCDLLDVEEMLVDEVRARIAAQFPGVSVWLGATHTHSGPDVMGTFSRTRARPDPALKQRIIAGASSAAESALAHLHPVWAKWTSGVIEGIAGNRDHPDMSANLTLDLLCFYDTEEQFAQPAALFASFPCHPTVLGAENLALSADLPGTFRRQLQALLGNDSWIALATGAAGDISTRHMRQGQGFDELERLGGLLARQAYALLPAARLLKLDLPRVRTAAVELERRVSLLPEELVTYTLHVQARINSALQAGNLAQARTLETVLQGLQAAQGRALTQAEQTQHVAASVALLNELALVAVPGELYNQLGSQILQASKRFVLLMGYTNGYVGYIPTQIAYAEMDYEILMSRFAPGSGERLVNALEILLKDE